VPDGWRSKFWEYYDRRAAQGVRGIGHAVEYWNGLGVSTTAADIEAEAVEVQRILRSLPPRLFLEVGAGPGTFSADLAGWGVALDQSAAALAVLRRQLAGFPAVRADALDLPFPSAAFGRVFAAHIYGLLPAGDRQRLLAEARRVGHETVVLDAGRPDGVPAEHWQDRTLPDGYRYRILRRHFTAAELAEETGGRALFEGRFYVLASAAAE
jgi:SAM-dependent methyltransferase